MDGTRYGRWTVLNPDVTYRAHDMVECRCDCGTIREVRRFKLTQGRSKSCGCQQHEHLRGKAWPNLAPDQDTEAVPDARFGRWTVLTHPESGKNRTVTCQCDCGNQRKVAVGHLLTGKSKSCGCLVRDAGRARHANAN